MTNLENRLARRSGTNHLIGFIERACDRFLNEHMDAGFQESTGDFAMNLSWHCQAYRINLPDNIMPVR
jgi:hypothetical protein